MASKLEAFVGGVEMWLGDGCTAAGNSVFTCVAVMHACRIANGEAGNLKCGHNFKLRAVIVEICARCTTNHICLLNIKWVLDWNEKKKEIKRSIRRTRHVSCIR